jgi:hypothetical protein
MAKKQAVFRFEEDFYADILRLAADEGLSATEVVRNALKTYAVLYQRTKDKKAGVFIETIEGDNQSRSELILPWLQ